jgi:hypothetical protein
MPAICVDFMKAGATAWHKAIQTPVTPEKARQKFSDLGTERDPYACALDSVVSHHEISLCIVRRSTPKLQAAGTLDHTTTRLVDPIHGFSL